MRTVIAGELRWTHTNPRQRRIHGVSESHGSLGDSFGVPVRTSRMTRQNRGWRPRDSQWEASGIAAPNRRSAAALTCSQGIVCTEPESYSAERL
jgi:hypothetical protein